MMKYIKKTQFSSEYKTSEAKHDLYISYEQNFNRIFSFVCLFNKRFENMIYFKFIKFLRDESAQSLVSIIKQIELNCMKFSAKKISKGNQ